MDEHTEGRILDLRDDVAQLQAEVDQLTAERDRLRAGIMTAEVHGEMIVRMRESVWLTAEAERDRLRAVVDALKTVAFTARLYLDARSLDPQSPARTDLENALAALDVSPAMGGLPSPQRATWAGMTGARFSDEGGVDPTSPTYDPDQYGGEVTVVGRRSAITLWHVINELADEQTGVDGNVIRGWLDTTVREALLGSSPADADQPWATWREYADAVKCPRCGGFGIDPDDPVQRTAKGLAKNEHMPCSECGGSGEVTPAEGSDA